MKLIKKLTQLITPLIILTVLIATPVSAAMTSDSYVIYDSVMHTFDGPVISAVNSSVSGNTATITWTTDIVADGFVIYDTVNTFTNSKEQGTSVKNATSHSVAVSGLSYSTTYYYKVKSTRINGGITTDGTVRSFTTGADTTVTTTPAGGGGMLIIDKTDKVAPLITNVVVAVTGSSSAQITWDTDEVATSFVEYGQSTAYGTAQGKWEAQTKHTVVLNNLENNILYHVRALSSDGSGNVSYSADQTFSIGAPLPPEEIEKIKEEEKKEEEKAQIDILAETTARLLEFINRIFPAVSLNELRNQPLANIRSLQDLINFIPSPILSGEPTVKVGAKDVTISWNTDIESNSLVALAPESGYKPNQAEPYMQITGDPETLTTTHQVKIYNLTPNTLYHYQLRSKAAVGPTARSRDFTFRTTAEELTISNFFTQVIDSQTAAFRWVTNKDADSTLVLTPYRGNVLAIDQMKTIKDNALSVIHGITVTDLEGGISYQVELISKDQQGNEAKQIISRFSTAEDNLPPEVSNIKAESTIFVDRTDQIQTVISWVTNEPATSRVYYQEGVQSSEITLAEQTILDTNYTKEHVMVVSKFKPGIVYSFRVESIDSNENTSLSQVHTFMTAKKKESIIQIIMKILGDTFGWINKLL